MLRCEFETSTPHNTFYEHLWVICNKIDRPLELQEVSEDLAREWALSIGGEFRCMSAKYGSGTSGFAREVASCLLLDAGK